MEWYALIREPVTLAVGAAAPGAVEFSVGRTLWVLVALLVAAVPLLLAARHALSSRREVRVETPRLRLLEGRKEIPRHAA
ncbi:MAG: hypothetical protein ACHQ9S_04360 [Candidatus Binatia bacterium]